MQLQCYVTGKVSVAIISGEIAEHFSSGT